MNRRNIVILVIIIFTTFYSCKVGRFIIYNYADINDHKKFPSRNIEKGKSEFQFPKSKDGKVPKKIGVNGKSYQFEKYLKDNKTVAFLIIQNDTI
ncbi:MAG: serine hydrolase, partial [Psychroflexus sp.]